MIKKQYRFKFDFKVSANRMYKAGTVLHENTDGSGYISDDKSSIKLVERYFVENNPTIFDDISEACSILIDDNRYIISKLTKEGADYTVLHQANTDLYVREGAAGSPFLLTKNSAVEQFNVLEFHDCKKNITYKVGYVVDVIVDVAVNPPGITTTKIDAIDFDGNIHTPVGNTTLAGYKLASHKFAAKDKVIYWPNCGHVVNICTGKMSIVKFSDLKLIDTKHNVVFASKHAMGDYMNKPTRSEMDLANARLTSYKETLNK